MDSKALVQLRNLDEAQKFLLDIKLTNRRLGTTKINLFFFSSKNLSHYCLGLSDNILARIVQHH